MSVYEMEIQVRFTDQDPMGHVNNAVYADYLQQARTDYFDDVLDEPLEAIDTVIVKLEIEYLEPISLDNTVRVTIDVPRLGESSIPMTYEILADGEVAATAETVQVCWDRAAGSSAPMPERWRERMTAYHELD